MSFVGDELGPGQRKRATVPGPLPPRFVLAQAGLYQKRTQPESGLMLARPSGFRAGNCKRAGSSPPRKTAYPLQLSTNWTPAATAGWPSGGSAQFVESNRNMLR